MTSQEPQTPFSANVDEMHETEVIVVSTPAPVFVDSTGRRRRVLRRLAYGFGALCMLYGGLVSVSLAGGPVSSSAVLPLPDLHDRADRPVAVDRPAPSTAPAVTPAPRSLFVTEALPGRPVSATSSIRPDGPRPPAATAKRRPSATPGPNRPTPRPTVTTRPVESVKTPTSSPSPTPTATPDETAPVPPVDPPPPAGGTGGGGSGGTGGGTGGGGTGSADEAAGLPPADAPVATGGPGAAE